MDALAHAFAILDWKWIMLAAFFTGCVVGVSRLLSIRASRRRPAVVADVTATSVLAIAFLVVSTLFHKLTGQSLEVTFALWIGNAFGIAVDWLWRSLRTKR